MQVAIHAIGDRANDLVLDMYKSVVATTGKRDQRFRVKFVGTTWKDRSVIFHCLWFSYYRMTNLCLKKLIFIHQYSTYASIFFMIGNFFFRLSMPNIWLLEQLPDSAIKGLLLRYRFGLPFGGQLLIPCLSLLMFGILGTRLGLSISLLFLFLSLTGYFVICWLHVDPETIFHLSLQSLWKELKKETVDA